MQKAKILSFVITPLLIVQINCLAQADHPISLGIAMEGISMVTSRDGIEPGYGTRMGILLDITQYYACVFSVGYLKIAEDNGLSPIDERQTIKTYDMPISLGLRARFSHNRIRPYFGANLSLHALKFKRWDQGNELDIYYRRDMGLGMEVGLEITTSRRTFVSGSVMMNDIANEAYLSASIGMAVCLIK